jgi:5-methylcytosine-specific restriction protein A
MWWIKKTDSRYALRDKHQRFYQSRQWQRLRLYILAEQPLCVECMKQNVNEPATVVDHIDSLTDRWDLRLESTNMAGLCSRHHNIKSAREQQRYRTGKTYTSTDDRMNELNDFQ